MFYLHICHRIFKWIYQFDPACIQITKFPIQTYTFWNNNQKHTILIWSKWMPICIRYSINEIYLEIFWSGIDEILTSWKLHRILNRIFNSSHWSWDMGHGPRVNSVGFSFTICIYFGQLSFQKWIFRFLAIAIRCQCQWIRNIFEYLNLPIAWIHFHYKMGSIGWMCNLGNHQQPKLPMQMHPFDGICSKWIQISRDNKLFMEIKTIPCGVKGLQIIWNEIR